MRSQASRTVAAALEWRLVTSDPSLSVERPLRLWRRERAWSRQLVAAFPESAFGWRPASDAFSCGELVIHLIQSERFWRRLLVEAAAGRRYDPFGLCGTAEQAETEAAFAAFTAEQLATAIVHHPVAGFVEPLGDMLWFMASHEVHHRGQLSAYAKMLGLPQPPLYTGDFGASPQTGEAAPATPLTLAEPLP